MKTRSIITTLALLCSVLASTLLPSQALAVGPQAPFTPPLEVSAPAQAVPADSAASAAEAPPPGLVGVRLGSTPAALIDGSWVYVGQPTRGARLVEVLKSAVRLRHPNGQIETLALFSDPTAATLAPRPAVSPKSAALRELP